MTDESRRMTRRQVEVITRVGEEMKEEAGFLRKVARATLPPIAVYWMKKLSGQRTEPDWEYVPEGWVRQVKGWNDESILEAQLAKWPQFQSLVQGTGPLDTQHEARIPTDNDYGVHNTIMSYAYVLALASRKKDRISILDWGSGIGHYYIISKALLPDVEIDYHYRDLPLLCNGGRQVLPQVSFYDNDEECLSRRYDLVLSSSSLQYFQDWKTLLRNLASAADPYLFITRIPIVNQANSFVVLQRPYRIAGYNTEILGWFFNRQELLDHVQRLRMRLAREFIIDERPFVPKAPEQGTYRGFLFRNTVND